MVETSTKSFAETDFFVVPMSEIEEIIWQK